MCPTPKIDTPVVRRLAQPASDTIRREGDFERLLRRNRAGEAADRLTTPMGLPGSAAQ